MRKLPLVIALGLLFALALLVYLAMPGVAQDRPAVLPAVGRAQSGVHLSAPAVTTTLIFQQEVSPTVEYRGVADTYISNEEPTGNWGPDTVLRLAYDNRRKILLRFDLSNYIPVNAVVTAAKLELYAHYQQYSGVATTVGVYRVLRHWVENEASWNIAASGASWQQGGCNGPLDRASDPTATTIFRKEGWQVWQNDSLKDLVQSWVSNPSSNYGILLAALPEQSRQFWTLDSSQYDAPTRYKLGRPKLTVSFSAPAPTATPTPSHTPTPTEMPATGQVSGLAWQDENRNRVRDAGEPPMPDITILLKDANYTEIARTTTLGDGSYEFPSLPAGNYVLTKEDPPGYLCTEPPGGVYAFYLARGQRLTGLNFGFALPATITPTPTPSLTPTLTSTPTRTATPTITPTGMPTWTPGPTPTATFTPTPTATPAGTLQDPIPVACERLYSGSTAGRSALVNAYGPCGAGMWGPEVVYMLQAGYAMDLSITLDTAADLVLFLLSSPNPNDCLATGGTIGAHISAGTYYIVVDGYGSGSYTIEIRCVPPPPETPTLTATPTQGPSPTPTRTQVSGPATIYLPIMRKAPLEFVVDCGSVGDYIDSAGKRWRADKPYAAGGWGYVGASEAFVSSGSISFTRDPVLYQTARYAYGSFGYQFDVPNGAYEVELYFAELWFAATNRRKFHVIIEGQILLNDYDIVAAAGGWLRAHNETFQIEVRDGQLNVDFALGPIDYPMINALRVTKIS